MLRRIHAREVRGPLKSWPSPFYEKLWGESIPGRRNSRYKGPEVGKRLGLEG